MLFVAAGALACLAPAPGALRAAAPPPVRVEGLRVGFGDQNTFKVGNWAPARIQLTAGDARFTGQMAVSVADDDGTPTYCRMPVDVPARGSQWYTAYVRPGSGNPDLSIRLFDAAGRRMGGASQDALLPNAPLALMPRESLLLTMGRPQGLERLMELPGYAAGGYASARATRTRPGEELVLARIDALNEGLPGRWYGFDSARSIVLDTSDPAVLQALDGGRGLGLVEWVRRGGHLIVTVGARWQALRDSVLEPILPALPNGLERVASLESLETFAGASKPILPPGTPRVMVAKLEEADRRGGTVLSVLSSLPLIVRGPCGFGRVTLIALDVDQKLFSEWSDAGLFWARTLDLRSHAGEQSTAGPPIGGSGRFYQNGATDLATQLRAGLEQFPGVKLVPFGWVAFFIFLYILLIGPGDYFFLKNVLKRMELTWITFPIIVVAVSLGAYYAAYVLKGNELLVNQVSVVDVDQVDGLVRGSTWASLFSPQNRDYSIRAVPLPLDHDADGPDAKSASDGPPRPAPGTEVLMSWFSAPDDQFGSMGSSGRRFSLGSGGYSYQPNGAAEFLENVRIPIWSTKSVEARWFAPASGPSPIDAKLTMVGTDRLAGTVTNRLDVPLKNALLAFGRQVYLLDDIEPGATLRVELSNDRSLSGYLQSLRASYMGPSTYTNPEFPIHRAHLMLAALFHDSESPVANERPISNHPLRHLDLTGQLALHRPMLAALVDRPGCRIVLDDGAGPKAKVRQTTLLRVLLPLGTSTKSKPGAGPAR